MWDDVYVVQGSDDVGRRICGVRQCVMWDDVYVGSDSV